MTAVKEVPRTTNGPRQEKEVIPEKAAAPERWYANPMTMMGRLAEEMDRVFEDFGFEPRLHFPRLFGRGREFLRRATRTIPAEWSPNVEVFEKGGQFVVRAELPGMTKDEVKVEITENVLTMQGERKQEKKEEREGYCYSECSYGSFYRAIPLPEGVDASKATADFKQGVLEVIMPAAPRPETKARRLEIREEK